MSSSRIPTELLKDVDFIKAFELLGATAPEIAYMCSPKAQKLRNMAQYYERLLGEEPKELIYEGNDGKFRKIIIQRETISKSKILKKVIRNLHWMEFNETQREKLSELKMLMAASAVGKSLKTVQKKLDEKVIEKYLLDNFDLSLTNLKKNAKKKLPIKIAEDEDEDEDDW